MMMNNEKDILADDAMLMLYVADELDAAARRAFDVRLAAEPGLREKLAGCAAMDSMLRADAFERPMPASESRRALASSLGLLERWPANGRPAAEAGARLRFALPRWTWPAAAAAVLAVGFVVWVGNSDPVVEQRAQETRLEFSDYQELASAFRTIEPAANAEDVNSQIDAQIDALSVLATMNELN